ncbi:MAG: hypothetical protein HY260_06390 [Chloroflexi bacterium]|nr:hypothetical protein [Chloroflexota bacterium]
MPSIFNETTGNFQAVTAQRQPTYRVARPKTMAALAKYLTDEPILALNPDPRRVDDIVTIHAGLW